MANETLARRYAQAVFSLAQEQGVVDRVGRDLETLRDAILLDAQTRAFFVAPVIDRKGKECALTASFSGKTEELALHAVLLLVRKRREPLLAEVVKQYGELEMQARGARPLTITSALELSPRQLDELVKELEQHYATHFEVKHKVDPQLIGGVRIMMGDRRIDGSVAGRLDELSRVLFGATT
ncbi:MAG: ATP synthase F1 subunit delta [Candidatus Eremiobacteraeota bacterium]|nr:ATP synthase F1 subunit delta [Candidatus Eremiobacteraeota bacterium]